MSIVDTRANATTNFLGNLQVQISRLAGREGINQIRLYDNSDTSKYIDISFSIFSDNALMVVWTPILDYITKPQIELSFQSGVKIQKESHAASKIYDKTQATWRFEHSDIVKMISDGLASITMTENVRRTKRIFVFKAISPSIYNSEGEGQELLKIICKTLAQEIAKYGIILSPEYKLASPPLKPPKVTPLTNPFTNTAFQPLSRQYNLDTKYGRKMANKQAQYNYDHGSEEYRNSIDNIGCVTWAVIISICALIFIIIWMVNGPDAALKWIK